MPHKPRCTSLALERHVCMLQRPSILMVLAIIGAALAGGCGATPVSVMPLGDSITAGSAGGYRKPMVRVLAETCHCAITTVGSQTDDSLPAGQQAHEGHGGWRIDQLADNLLGVNPVDQTSH